MIEPPDRLESWKEIAAYLKRDVRTVQRWEASEALPVRRHQHKKRGSVVALRSELDAWRESRSAEFFGAPDAPRPERRLLGLSRWRSPLLAAALGAILVTAGLSSRSGRSASGTSASGAIQDAPRLLGEMTRDGGAFERIPIAATGQELALAPNGRMLFVAVCKDDGTSSLQAIDTGTRAIAWTVEPFGSCAPIVVTPSGDRVITADKSQVVIVETATRAVRRIATPAALLRDLALARDGRTLFAAALFQGLLEIDIVSARVLTKSQLPCPVSLAVSPATDVLYVGYQCSGPGGRPGHDAIEILDTKSGRSSSITNLPNVGSDLLVSPDGSQLWADGADACVSPYYDQVGCPPGVGSIINVIGTADHSLLRSLRLGGHEDSNTRLSVLGDGRRVVAGRSTTNVISTASLKPVEALPLQPWSNVVSSPDGTTAYVVIGDKLSVAVLPIIPRPAPPPGLTARWTADGVFTDSGGGNDIPKEARGAFGPGRIGQALRVGTGPPIRFPRPPHLGMGARMSAMAWFKGESTGTIMEYAATDALGQFGWRLMTRADGALALCLGRYEQGQCGGQGSATIAGNARLRPGRWHHLAFTRSDETAVFYLDGRPVGTASGLKGGYPLLDIQFLRLGSGEAAGVPIRGWLDEIEVYNRPLSPEEVAERSK